VNDCCHDMKSRGPVEKVSDDLSFTRCQVCGARHFELKIDPAELAGEVESL